MENQGPVGWLSLFFLIPVILRSGGEGRWPEFKLSGILKTWLEEVRGNDSVSLFYMFLCVE